MAEQLALDQSGGQRRAIHFYQRPVVARDMEDPRDLDFNTCYASVAATSKHVGTSWVEPEHVEESLAMLHMMAGSEEAWRARPFVSMSNCFVVPPMKFAQDACRCLEVAVRGGLPVLLLAMLFTASTLVYSFEKDVQPQDFGSIPHAMWWGIATLTTVGYGDVVPQSSLGKALGGLIMLSGIAMFATPAGILAAAFAEEAKRKNFIVTWNLVAHVPFFSHLGAREIARIAELLRPRTYVPNEVILHRDEDAASMFFIVSGEVEVLLEPEPIRYTKGAFFGEISLLFNVPRTATVVAARRSDLLELDAQELHRLLDANPKLKSRILKIATQRYDQVPHGQDISHS